MAGGCFTESLMNVLKKKFPSFLLKSLTRTIWHSTAQLLKDYEAVSVEPCTPFDKNEKLKLLKSKKFYFLNQQIQECEQAVQSELLKTLYPPPILFLDSSNAWCLICETLCWCEFVDLDRISRRNFAILHKIRQKCHVKSAAVRRYKKYVTVNCV